MLRALIGSFTAVILLSAQAFAADLNRAVELFDQGKFAEAEPELRAAVEAEPENARARRYLGLALLEQGKPADEAAPHITKAGELEPGGESRLALARLYVERNEFDKAEEALKEAEGSQLEYVRARVHLERKRYNEAAQDFETFIEKNTGHAYAHYYAGLAYNGLRRPDKMLTHFQLFLKMKPDAPEARKVRAVLKTAR